MANLTANTPKTARARAQKLLVRYAEVGMELDLLKNERKPLEEEYANLRRALQDYADDATNAADFNDKQMLRLDSGSFGYRAGTEKLTWDLDRAEAEPLRTQQVCAVLKKLLPTAIKTSYDEKAIVKV